MVKTRKTNLKKVYKKKRKKLFRKKFTKKKKKRRKRKLNKRSRRRPFSKKGRKNKKSRKTRRKQKGGYCCNYERHDGHGNHCARPLALRKRSVSGNPNTPDLYQRNGWDKRVFIRTLVNVPGPRPGVDTYSVVKIMYKRHIYKHMQDLGFNCYVDTAPAVGAWPDLIGTNGLTLHNFLINAFGTPRPPAPLPGNTYPMYVKKSVAVGTEWWNANNQANSMFNQAFLQYCQNNNLDNLLTGYIPTDNWIQFQHGWHVSGNHPNANAALIAARPFFRVYYKIVFKRRRNPVGAGGWKFRNLIEVVTMNLAIVSLGGVNNRIAAPLPVNPPPFAPPAGAIAPTPKTLYVNKVNDVTAAIVAGTLPNAFSALPWISDYMHNNMGDEMWWSRKRGMGTKERKKNLHEAWYQQNPAERWNLQQQQRQMMMREETIKAVNLNTREVGW